MPRVFAPALLSALLLWASFFPLDLGPLACVALVPLLTLVRAAGVSARRRYLAAFVGGLVFYGLALNWVRVAHPMMMLFAWPGGAVYCGLSWPLALFLLRKLDRAGLPTLAGVPAVWVGLEYVRTHFPTGFPFLAPWFGFQSVGFGWYQLGHALHRALPLIQCADLGGVYLLSLAVAGVNAALLGWAERSARVRRLLRWPARTDPRPADRELWGTALAFALPAALVAYGVVRLEHPKFRVGPRVAALQGDLPQDLKMVREGRPGDLLPTDAEYFPLARDAGESRPGPDLVVWPETCFGYDWPESTGPGEPPDLPDFARRAARARQVIGRDVAKLTTAPSLLGLNVLQWDGVRLRKSNTALLVGPDGAPRGRYDKIHLVPFGEYVPLRETFPWLQQLTPYTHDYSCTPGEALTRFELPTADRGTFTFGVLICYEDTDPLFARRYNPSAGGDGVDFLVNTSNDGWFHGTEEHRQHLAICKFRAVEARRGVVRAVNMGVSAVIDPDGRVLAELPPRAVGVLRAAVPVDDRGSVYAAWGDWVPAGCWLVAAGGLLRGRKIRPRVSGAGADARL